MQATDQACAGAPRGVYGASPSKISLTWPSPSRPRCPATADRRLAADEGALAARLAIAAASEHVYDYAQGVRFVSLAGVRGGEDVASALAQALGEDATGEHQRNDLIFWKGHVAMVVDDSRLIHANAGHMAVAYEGIDVAIRRVAALGEGPVIARRRVRVR